MRRIVFLMSGPGHLPNVVVALHTLRRHYDGQVDIFAWKESLPIVKRISGDPYLNVGYIPWESLYRGHSDTYVDKTRLIQSLRRGDDVLFLDADVTVHGSLDVLFDGIAKHGCVATQFNDWVTTGGTIGGRLKTLRQFPEIDAGLIDAALARPYPSVNTGIFGARPESPVLSLWHKWTYVARSTFIPDEKVMHLMAVKFGPTGEIAVATGGRWNCSPKLQPEGMADRDVVVMHYHGDSNLRPSKSQRGFDLWRKYYRRAMDADVGGIREWHASIPNKHYQKLLTEGLL